MGFILPTKWSCSPLMGKQPVCVFGTVKESSDTAPPTDAVLFDSTFGLKANQWERAAVCVPRQLPHGGSSRHISAPRTALGHK